MKTSTKLLASVFGLLFTLWGTQASAVIAGSAHDLSTLYGSNEICAYCHTPHNAAEPAAGPLWDRVLTTTSFAVYTSPLGTLNATLAQPAGASKLCLGCHDGTVAMEAFGGGTGTSVMGGINANKNLGADLSNDHPISFAYADSVTGGDTQLVLEATVAAAGLLIGGTEVECASCHDVHNNSGVPGVNLLRVSMTAPASGLCLTCHAK